MLQLFHSNRLEILATHFAEVLSAQGLEPFQAEQVVVQNAGMGRWLSLQLAQQTGIAANLKYLFPAEITWELLRAVLPDVPERDPCSPGLLRWRLLDELEQRGERYQHDLGHYLNSQIASASPGDTPSHSSAAWDLAKQVATVFDGYLFFRPDWVREWGQEVPRDWQQHLWRNVIAQPGLDNWISLQSRFIQQLTNTPAEKLPARISFFSVPALSPPYIEMIAKVAEKTDVYFFVMNPSWQYWGDIESNKRKIKRALSEQEYVTVGNPLLASWGTQGRDFIENLRDTDPYPQEGEAFAESTSQSLLLGIQADILNLEGEDGVATLIGGEVDVNIKVDDSLRLHSCHSAMREVEVLYDQLLAALEANKALTPADMVIMSPEIENYAPFVEAVFSSASVYLPYSIADQRFSTAKNITAATVQIMELPQSKFEADTVFSLLEYQEVRTCFGLDEVQVQQCRDWVRAVNIRWGVDETFRRQFASQTSFEHTWMYGLDRLLLGYMMPGDELLAGVLPYNELEGSDVLVLERFLQCVHTLFSVAKWSEQRHDIGAWCERFRALVGRMFSEDAEIYPVTQALDKLNESVRQAEFSSLVAWAVFRDALKSQLEQNNRADGFLGSGITFCTLMPMRSVPFKFVALLGMQDGGFPRQDTRVSFDKLAWDKRRRGDRSRRDEDRYLFLESVLSARERLYISYIGQSVLDNASVMPSVLVSELLDYVEKRYGVAAEQLTTKHPLQAFSRRYFDGTHDELFSYRTELAQLQAEQAEQHSGLPFWDGQQLDEPDEGLCHITLVDLIRFYRQPARYFLSQRFDLVLYEENETLAGREPFVLEAFSDGVISQQILNRLPDGTPHKIEAVLRAQGLLPHGAPGELLFEQQYTGVKSLAAQVPEITEWCNVTVELSSESVELGGELAGVSAHGRHILLFGHVGVWQWLEIWLQHLVLNGAVTLPDDWLRETYVYTAEQCYVLKPVADASQQLSILLTGYWQGLQQPLPFFPKSAWKMMEAKEPVIEVALREWLANDAYHRGEALKPEHELLYRGQSPIQEQADEFMYWAQQIFGGLKRVREVISSTN